MIISSFCVAQNKNKGDFIKILYENKDYIISTYNNCKRISSYSGRVIPCGGSSTKPIFDTLISAKSIEIWRLHKEILLQHFIRFYNSSYNAANSNYHLVNEDSLVKILIHCLSDTTVFSSNVVGIITGSLAGYTARPQLIKHSKLIREMRNPVNEKIKGYKEILILSNTERKEADSLLKSDSTMPLHYRARLCDSKAVDSLLKMYDEEKTNFFRKSRILKMLAFVGNKKCIRKLIIKFNEPLYDYCKGHKHLTIRYKILKELYLLFPDVPVFRDKFYNFSLMGTGNLYNKGLIKEFVDDFLLWAEKEYNVKPENENEYLFQGNIDCTEY